jgi:DNA-binding transcriptional MerR regulator
VDTIEGDGVEDYGEEGARRVYDFTALRRVLLIKQLLEQGRGLKRATREVESFLQQAHDQGLKSDADRRSREEALHQQTERLEHIAEQVRTAVQRGRVHPTELKDLSREIHFFLELMAYEESATLHLQEDITAANQFRSMLDQLTLHVEDTVGEPSPALRRAVR